ncbi:MAG: peptidoglycan-binding protein [Rhodobacteraceae bacterium]|nr:peptidoglycan-binding protein [Paracoccaceae bacterium]
MIRHLIALSALALLTGCEATSLAPQPGVSRSAALGVTIKENEKGECWAVEVTPAVYDTVMGQVQVVQAEIAPDGTVLRAPIYRNTLVPRVVKDRQTLRFQTPCPAQLTPEFIGSLQRALRARGYFRSFTTSIYDDATRRGVLRYQTERGLQSGRLSLETARDLGLIAVERSDTR